MYRQIQDIGALLDQIDHNTLVLTPNLRLSRYIHAEYAKLKTFQQRAWPSLNCYSLNTWMKVLWQQLQQKGAEGSDAFVLEPVEELLIWQKIIEDDEQNALLNASGAARNARSAWHTLIQWRLLTPGEQLKYSALFEQPFLNWLNQYQNFCARQQLCDNSMANLKVITQYEQLHFSGINKIFLFSFDQLPPLHEYFFESLGNKGISIQPVNLDKDSFAQRQAFLHQDEEIKHAALWASQKLHAQPGSRIAVVFPDLQFSRGKIERLFHEVFEPQSIFSDEVRHAPGFNISASQNLSQTPIGHIANLALKLGQSHIDMDSLGNLLRSPFICTSNTLFDRARLELNLLQKSQKFSSHELRAQCAKQLSSDHPFYARLQAIHEQLLSQPKQRSASDWAQTFLSLLQNLGWPGDRRLNSLEYQQVQSYLQTLQKLGRLDYILGALTYSSALKHLELLSQNTEFHPQTKNSPIQILGLMEAAGLSFDAVWVCGLDHQSWPPSPAPNPFIPIALQLQFNMPHSSAQRELEICRSLTQTLKSSGDEVIFSYCTTQQDRVLMPSPLIEHILEKPTNTKAPQFSDFYRTLEASADIELFQDNIGPKIDDPSSVRGGTRIIKEQAACPFRAFALFRLDAEAPEEVSVGLNPMERGNLIHNALDIIWRQLKNQSRLLQNDSGSLNALIEKAAQKALMPFAHKLGASHLSLEKTRTEKLLHQWLELEKQRRPFKVVHRENRKTVKLKKLPINIRYDRIDELEDGSHFIIDYKTGKPDIHAWYGQRPDEPQIPIYCISRPRNLEGAAFGQLHVEGVALKGIVRHSNSVQPYAPGLKTPEEIPKQKLPPSLEDILEHWKTVLENLAQEYIAGQALVEPKKGAATCRYCHLQNLCRVKEVLDVDEDSEAYANDDDDGAANDE